MSSETKFEFHGVTQTATGQGSQNMVGQNTNTVNIAGGGVVPTVEQVFKAVEDALPDDVYDEVKKEVTEPLVTMAEMPVEAAKADPTFMERAEGLLERLKPYVPQITNGLAVFGTAALESLGGGNLIVAGLLALCKAGVSAASEQS